MKAEFAALMQKRADLVTRNAESARTLAGARSTTDQSAPANSATAEEYRKKVFAVEQALDEHPRVKAMQALYDAAQTDKVAVSVQTSLILNQWAAQQKATRDQINAAVAAADRKVEDRCAELMRQAGVTRFEELSEADRKRIAEIRVAATNEMHAAALAYRQQTDTNAIAAAHLRDGSARSLAESKERYASLERQQADYRRQILALRDELRRSDPGIRKLVEEAQAASRAHVQAMEDLPEVKAAREFLAGAETRRQEIDRRARVLRRGILSAEPAYKPTLDRQATPAGLASVGEDFWNVEG
jgi:hypothetical protein